MQNAERILREGLAEEFQAVPTPSTAPTGQSSVIAFKPRARRTMQTIMATLLLGVVSGLLYGLLYYFSNDLVSMATQTREGHKVYALMPIAIALTFSLVHGSFTGHFWEILGLKAKGK